MIQIDIELCYKVLMEAIDKASEVTYIFVYVKFVTINSSIYLDFPPNEGLNLQAT